jgi:hypothetical protein
MVVRGCPMPLQSTEVDDSGCELCVEAALTSAPIEMGAGNMSLKLFCMVIGRSALVTPRCHTSLRGMML